MSETQALRYFVLLPIVVLDEKGKPTFLLLQRKDGGHPNPAYHWKFTVFGGASKETTDPYQVLKERLRQQFGAAVVVEALAQRATLTEIVERPMQDSSGQHLMTVMIATLDWSSFLALKSRLMLPDEGHVALLSLQEVRTLMQDPAYFLPDIPAMLKEVLPELLG